MHAFRRYLQEQMDERHWLQTDLSKASGLSKQALSKMLNDDRDELTTRIDDRTAVGLARAFGVSPEVVLARVGEAMRLPVGKTLIVYSAEHVSNEDLIRVLKARLTERGSDRSGDTAEEPTKPTRGRALTTHEVAAADHLVLHPEATEQPESERPG